VHGLTVERVRRHVLILTELNAPRPSRASKPSLCSPSGGDYLPYHTPADPSDHG
jgi:hypothetical protein